jgi:pimeloyl-ACP methyl ester carboxylesterase
VFTGSLPKAPPGECEYGGVVTLLLIHGGLWDDMTAERFWHEPGIVRRLEGSGFHVLVPDRERRATDWGVEVDHLVQALPDHSVTVVAGSNGCSVAVRLALALPDRVSRLLLAWPATAGDPLVDSRDSSRLVDLGASPDTVSALLAGETLRGATRDELATVTMSVGVLPAVPPNLVHQRRTVDELLHLLPSAEELPGSPEPPTPDFAGWAGLFVDSLERFAET